MSQVIQSDIIVSTYISVKVILSILYSVPVAPPYGTVIRRKLEIYHPLKSFNLFLKPSKFKVSRACNFVCIYIHLISGFNVLHL